MKNLQVIGEVKRFKIRINNILGICKQNIQEYKNIVIPSKECFVRDIKELMKLHQKRNYKNKDKKKIEILLNRTAKFLKYDTETLQKLKAKEYYYGRVSFIDKLEAINDYNDDLNIKLAKEIINNSVDIPRLKNILEDKKITIKAVDEAVYETVKNGVLWKALFISHNFILIRENIITNIFEDLTKNDTEVSRETLSDDEVIQALNNSISKFIELYYQQPKELKHILIDYEKTPIKDYLEVTENAINNSDDIKLLDKLFQTYKRDKQHRIYNYDLFAFLYYAYELIVSIEHLYNAPLLNSLGIYTFKADRDKPILKKNKVSILQEHKKNVELTQYDENIYLHNLIAFIKAVNTKYKNKYLLSFLVDISHNLKASKEFMQSLTCKNSFKNDTYQNLPQPINTLLLTPSQIAN